MNFVDAVKKSIKTNQKIRNCRIFGKEWLDVARVDKPLGRLVLKKGQHEYEYFTLNIILDDAWETEEYWYENFQEKYPDGVYCEARNEGFYGSYKVIIVDYEPIDREFEDANGNLYEYAEPISKVRSPAFRENLKGLQ